MTLNTRIDQFLTDVHNPTNLTTTRTHLATAVGLLREVQAGRKPAAKITASRHRNEPPKRR